MSTSHLTMAQSSLTFTPNLQTKTNTYYIRHVIPYTLERAISFSLALRLRHICSTNETFTLRTNEIIYYLNKCVYNLYFLQGEIQQVNNITRTEALTPHDTCTLDKQESVPFVITYNPTLRFISPLFANTFKSLFHPPVAITSLKLHPL